MFLHLKIDLCSTEAHTTVFSLNPPHLFVPAKSCTQETNVIASSLNQTLTAVCDLFSGPSLKQ